MLWHPGPDSHETADLADGAAGVALKGRSEPLGWDLHRPGGLVIDFGR